MMALPAKIEGVIIMMMEKHKMAKIRKTLVAYMFMAPALLILAVFLFYPIIYSLPLAFFDYSIIGETTYVGWKNFSKAINDDLFWIAVKNSVLFVLVVPPIQILSMLLAMLVNRKIRGINFFRALYYIPVVTSMIAVSIIWGWIFDPDGVINTFLLENHIIKQPIYFLADKRLALFSLMFITLWQGLGYYMMIYLSGLQSVPLDLEESAMIDGANKFWTIVKIKVPLLKPFIWFSTLVSVLSAVSVFDVVFVLTEGGPDNGTLVTSYYSYAKAFVDFNFGYSAAIGLLVSIVTTVLSALVFAYGKKGGMGYYYD